MHDAFQRQAIRDQLRQAALAAWNHYRATGLHLTAEEADAWLVKLENGESLEPHACHI
ncbi:MAG: hypothetical protein ABR860_09345 [Terracidiphilus sp.]|jgi:predicted transcriptional regulator